MATSPGIKGNPLYANSDDMAGPAQISAVSAWAADHAGEQVDTAAHLPSTGNWAGRSIYVVADDQIRVNRNGGTDWGFGDGDTGWITPTLASGWIAAASTEVPKYRLKSGYISFTGRPANGTSGLVFTLPVGYRPNQIMRLLVSTSSSATATLATINTDGTIGLVVGTQPNLASIAPFAPEAS